MHVCSASVVHSAWSEYKKWLSNSKSELWSGFYGLDHKCHLLLVPEPWVHHERRTDEINVKTYKDTKIKLQLWLWFHFGLWQADQATFLLLGFTCRLLKLDLCQITICHAKRIYLTLQVNPKCYRNIRF